MALVYQGTELGYMIVKCGKKKERVSLRQSNALACWIYVYKEKGKWYHMLWDFWADEQHVRNLKANGHDILRTQDGVVEIGLNLYHKESKKILDILVKEGFKVICFYE